MKVKLLIVMVLASVFAVVHSAQTQKACPSLRGPPGIPGSPGFPGLYGRDGVKGEKGTKGDVGAQAPSNWKQCVWRKGDGRDNGLIKECVFQKREGASSLRVFYSGSLRIYACTNCCKRWFFTFNGAECSGPMAIDGVIHMHLKGLEPLRVRHIEGYCENIPRGAVRVGFHVGNCVGFGNADAYSGWNSVSRIMIEEVPAPQK